MVADSFRVRESDGVAEVRGFSLHIARFTSSVIAACAEVAAHTGTSAHADTDAILPEHRLEEFLGDAISQIATYGVGNPRIELWGGPGCVPELRLSLRPLPTLRDTIQLRSATSVDTHAPERKGANIGLFAGLNRSLEAEALLIAGDGSVVEGTTTSIVWWQGNAGFVVGNDARVHSITEQLVHEIAIHRGTPLTLASATAEDLTAHEVWAVNALHGIRPVTHINGKLQVKRESPRLETYREALDRTWERVAAPHHVTAPRS